MFKLLVILFIVKSYARNNIYIMVIFMNNFIPIDFAEMFLQFIPIKIFKNWLSISLTRWWRLYKIFQNNKVV